MKKHVAMVLMCALGAPSVAFAQDRTLAPTYRDASSMAVPAMTPTGPLLRAAQIETWRAAAALDRPNLSQGPMSRPRVTPRQAAIIALSAGIAGAACYVKARKARLPEGDQGAKLAGPFYCGLIAGVVAYGVITLR